MARLLSVILLLTSYPLLSQSPFLDSVRHSISRLPETEQIQHLYNLADEYSYIRLKESKSIAEEGLVIARKIEEEKSIFDGLLLLGELGIDIPDFKYADSMFNMAMLMAQEAQDPDMIMRAKFKHAKSLSMQGNLSESTILQDEIIREATEAGDSLMLARALMGKGLNHDELSDYETALEYYYQALSIYEKLDDQMRIGVVRTNIGMSFLNLNRNTEALAEFQTALQLSEKTNDKQGILAGMLNIGVAYERLGQYQLAKETFIKSLAKAKSQGSWYDIALLRANLGTTAMKMGNYNEARISLERACHIKDSIGYQHDLPHTLNSLAEAYIHLGNYDLALINANEASRLALTYNKLDQLSESHRILAEVYAAKNNYDAAYDHLLQHKKYSDSLFSTESDKTISNLKIRHETEAKENQITKLTADNKRSRTAKLVFLGMALLILITGASLIYAQYIRRNRDKVLLAKERELHEMQNQFFANISHEFRTPLSLILGPIHNLKRQFKGTKEESVLRIIQKNAERLLHHINQILDLTKFDKKVLELKKESFILTRMMKGICSSFDSMAESRDIQYGYEIDDGLTLFGDIRRLEIVLINLISNAFKFTPDHGAISIKAALDETGDTFSFQVKDSGKGIAQENLSKIFNRYYHDDREAHADFEGMGIGLALSKHIVDMHNGTISVTSKINEGSVFTVSLPHASASYVEDEITVEDGVPNELNDPLMAAADVQPLQKTNGVKPMLLLVEDRMDMRGYITSLLVSHYKLIEAADAFDGFQKAIEFIPDIIISDVMMPRKSGLELCRELKSDMRTSHIPVLLLTARASTEDRISGLETEADVYLTKPFIPEELELNLRNLIASRQKLRAFYEHHRQIEPSKMAFNSVDEQFLKSFVEHLEAHYSDEAFSVEQLAELIHLSRSQLHRKLIALTGQSPNRLIRTFRLKRAYDMVSSHAASIAEISYSVGFGSPAYFTKCFVEEFGVTPVEVRDQIVNISP